MQTMLDTNCLLRYLLADNEKQFELVTEQVKQGACTAPEFIAECVYVLAGQVYGFSKSEVSDSVTALLDDIDCEHSAALVYALKLFKDNNLDFADCILAARHFIEDVPVLTFDKKLLKVIDKLSAKDSL